MLSSRIIELTVPSSDNGKKFVRTDRLNLIRCTLDNSEYECLADRPLAKVYRHRAFRTDRPTLLVSCHIDSLYGEYYATTKDGELQGTFDNSACNAVAVEGMLNAVFPAQVLISFTGDEERKSKGVNQTIKSLLQRCVFANLEMVVTLDLTEEHYGSDFTVENYFVEQDNSCSLLRFDRKMHLKTYLKDMIGLVTDKKVFVKNGEEDESWKYDEYDLNCFSLCLPCRVLGKDMHDKKGVAIPDDSIVGYMNALEKLICNIDKDLANRVI